MTPTEKSALAATAEASAGKAPHGFPCEPCQRHTGTGDGRGATGQFGHLGMPTGTADIATVLFTRFLKIPDPRAPHWPDRDRFEAVGGPRPRCCSTPSTICSAMKT